MKKYLVEVILEVINRCTTCRLCSCDLDSHEWRLCDECRLVEKRLVLNQNIQSMYDLLVSFGDECEDDLKADIMGSIEEYEQELMELDDA